MHNDPNHFPMHHHNSSYVETKRNMTSITLEDKETEEAQNWGGGAEEERLMKNFQKPVTCRNLSGNSRAVLSAF
jgi:hypothetical protein